MDRKQILSWCFYDFANTIYSAMFVSFLLPVFVKNHLGGTESAIGWVTGGSTLLVIFIIPAVGAFSDWLGLRLPFLAFFTVLCCCATAVFGFLPLQWALLAAVVANTSFQSALPLYDALLPKLAPPERHGQVSGWGVGIGYLGTLASLGVTASILSVYGWESTEGMQVVFIATGASFLICALVSFLGIREERRVLAGDWREAMRESFRGLFGRILGALRRTVFRRFLLGMFWYSNAVAAVIVFFSLFGMEELGLSVTEFLMTYAAFSVASFGGAMVAGRMVDRFGGRRVLLFAGVLWMGLLVFLLLAKSLVGYLIAGCLGGAAMGTVWTASRPVLIRLAKPGQMAEHFGFLAVMNKASGAVGPVVFGYLAEKIGYDVAVSVLLVFFAAGMFCLWRVREE